MIAPKEPDCPMNPHIPASADISNEEPGQSGPITRSGTNPVSGKSVLRTFVVAASAAFLLSPYAGAATATFTSGTDLTASADYSPSTAPTATTDILFDTPYPTTSAILQTGAVGGATATALTAESLNVLNLNGITIGNNSSNATPSNANLTLGNGGGQNDGVSGAAAGDLIYIGGATSSLTIQGPNLKNGQSTGTGVLNMVLAQSGNFDVAGSGASLSISSIISGAFSIAKTGSGTLTLSGVDTFGGSGKTFTLTSGTLNINNAKALGAASTTFQISGGTTINNTSGLAVGAGNVLPLTVNGDFTFTGGGTGNSNDLNLGTGAVSLGTTAGTTRTITTAAANSTLTIGGAISNGTTATGLIKTGAGILTLSGASTYAGGLNIENGTVIANISNATTVSGAAGPSGDAITLGNSSGGSASLLANSNFTVSNLINLGAGAAGTLTVGDTSTATTPTLSGAIALNGDNLNLTSNGTGTMVISGPLTGGVAAGTATLTLNGSGPATLGGGVLNDGSNGAKLAISAAGSGSWNLNGATTATTASTYASGTSSITLPSVPAGLIVGDFIAGPGIQVGTTVTSITSGTTIGLSLPTNSISLANNSVAFSGFSGGVILSSGTLNINSVLSLGTGPFTISGGTLGSTVGLTVAENNSVALNADFNFDSIKTLNLGSGPVSLGASAAATRTITFNSDSSVGVLSINGLISNSNGGATATTLIKAGPGTLTVGDTSNTFSNLIVTGGTVGSGAGFTGITGINVPSNGTLTSPVSIGTPFGTGTISLNGGGIAYGFGAPGSNPTYAALQNPINLTGTGTVLAGGGSKREGVLTGLISGGGTLQLSLSQGTLGSQTSTSVTGLNNTYSGGTNLDAQTSGSTAVLIQFVAGATNALGGGVGGTGGVVTFTNSLNLASQVGSALALTANQSIAGLASSTANSNGLGLTFVTGFSSSTPVTLTINNVAGGTGDGSVYAGSIGGSPTQLTGFSGTSTGGNNINLIKAGTGTQTLSGSSTYTGSTTVSGGILIVSGSLSGTASVSVSSGAELSVTGSIAATTNPAAISGTLAGTGSLGGSVNLTGGVIAPGTLGSALTVGGTGISLDSASSFAFTLGNSGTTSDSLNSSATINLASGATLTLLDPDNQGGSFAAGNSIQLFTGSPNFDGTTFTNFDLPTLAAGLQWSETNLYTGASEGQLDVVSAVPEPGTWGLLLGGAGMLIGVQCMRRRGRE